MARVLVLRPGRFRRAFEEAAGRLGLEAAFHEAEGAEARPDRVLEELVGLRDAGAFRGLCSPEPWPGAVLAAAAARETGLPGPDPEAALLLLRRRERGEALERAVPGSVPASRTADPARPGAAPLPCPFLVRPSFDAPPSKGLRVESPEAWPRAARAAALPVERSSAWNALLKRYARGGGGAELVSAEEALPGRERLEALALCRAGRARLLGLSGAEGPAARSGAEGFLSLAAGVLGCEGLLSAVLLRDPASGALAVESLAPSFGAGPFEACAASLELALGRAPALPAP